MKIIAWIFGVGAMISLFCIYQQKSRKKLIIAKFCADVCWSVHYFCLRAYGGIVPNALGIVRELVFMHRDDRTWASKPVIPILFILANWCIGALTFSSPINILPIAASTFVTISLWLRKPRLTKIISIPVSLTFLIYDVFVGSYIGIVNEGVALLSIFLDSIKTIHKKGDSKMTGKSIFSPDFATKKQLQVIAGTQIGDSRARITSNVSEAAKRKGEQFAEEIRRRFVADFEKKTDKMAHVSTFARIDDTIYMTYYANCKEAAEDPNNQVARLAYCPCDNPENMTWLDVQAVGDDCFGKRIEMVYDTIFARRDDKTLILLWTAKAEGNYYRFYRYFDIPTKTLGDVGVNRLKVGDITNDFSTSGMVSAFSENGFGLKPMYSDIGIMQKFTKREENGETYFYTGAYSGDQNFIIKSRDFITWEYVSQPDFPNLSKWENATYVLDGKIYYFVRQADGDPCGFLTCYHIDSGSWETPVLIDDCQSRSDFIRYHGGLYLFHAPIDREHIGVIRIDTEDLANSRVVLQANMHGSCFYPFVQHFGDELAMSYTVSRQHIRLARFDFAKYCEC